MSVEFLVTKPERGALKVTGPVTGIDYDIAPSGTPVNSLDVPGILAMVGDPCCGHVLPFGGKVKLFFRSVPSVQQMGFIPEQVATFKLVPPKKEFKKAVVPVPVEIKDKEVKTIEVKNEEVEPKGEVE